MMTKTRIAVDKIFLSVLKKNVISEERKEVLHRISDIIISEIQEKKSARLNFICTHNSRRSQFSQVWAHYAIEYFGLDDIASFSSGTEVTAFHKNTIAALEDCGFKFMIEVFSHTNPHYEITYEGNKNPIKGFSKLVDDATNNKPFIAITTCDSADQNCPYIPEALYRIHLPFVDPKVSDDTSEQSEVYLRTSKLIAAEMGYVFARVKKKLAC